MDNIGHPSIVRPETVLELAQSWSGILCLLTVVSLRISLYKLLAVLVQQCPSFRQLFATPSIENFWGIAIVGFALVALSFAILFHPWKKSGDSETDLPPIDHTEYIDYEKE